MNKGWQDFSTAPKEENAVAWLFIPHTGAVVLGRNRNYCWTDKSNDFALVQEFTPTRWMDVMETAPAAPELAYDDGSSRGDGIAGPSDTESKGGK